jgi:hypothetical protein
MKLGDWFQYSDREKPPYNPTTGTTITIEGFWRNELSECNSPDWRREEWLIHSALVPVDQLKMAATEIRSPHGLTFEIGWNSDHQFSFGDYSQYGEIQLYALAQLPLVGLNELRIGSAHIGNPELEPIFQLMGASTIPETPRAGWNLCVDAVANCLCSIAGTLET